MDAHPDATQENRSSPEPLLLQGMLEVARAHREHERYHSLLKLEEAATLRRDSNALKVLADRWLEAPDGEHHPVPVDSAYGAVGCTDLNDPVVVATTGILFMEDEPAPAELTAIEGRLQAAAAEYGQLSRWLVEKMAAAWPRLTAALLTPELADAARPRFTALSHTTAAGTAYGLAAQLLHAAVHAMRGQDLSPHGVRADPAAAATMLRSAAWLADQAAATIAEAAARLGRSDPDWTAFIAAITSRG
ncbi:hypothetical protein [Nonomuraea helvata]|uniref:Uncharacterized protein n=1 Tax=Nonomuraea helvata TaxID=37484 RepID=A0ABV5S736_9ACTN